MNKSKITIKRAHELCCGEIDIMHNGHFRIRERSNQVMAKKEIKDAIIQERTDGRYVNVWYVFDGAFDADLIIGFYSSSGLSMRVSTNFFISWLIILISILVMTTIVVFGYFILSSVPNTPHNVLMVLLPSIIALGVFVVVIGHQSTLIDAERIIKEKLPYAKRIRI